jgi:LacI family transcriptional regulator
MRPTTKDLAKAAGVSLATVDRVLNDRPGVTERTVIKVNETIEKIGFARNIQAANLARNKSYQFQFILPSTGGQFLSELLCRIEEANQSYAPEMIEAYSKQIIVDDPHSVANYLASLSARDVDGVAIMVPESPQVRDAITRLSERGIEAVQFLSGQPKASKVDFVGIDSHAAGATAGRLVGSFSKVKDGKIIVIADTMQARDSIERRLGFDETIGRLFPQLHVLPSLETYGNVERAHRVIKQCIENNPKIVGAYVLSSEAQAPIDALDRCVDTSQVTIVAHERTPFTENALRQEMLDAIIAQNTGHAVRSAIRIMRARGEQRQPLASQETIRIEILLRENL